MEYLGLNKVVNKISPIVSVCVITYNHEEYISECLDSILMQELDFPYEIILGEDDSTDKTREICIDYADRYPDKIRLFLREEKDKIYINGRKTGRFNILECYKDSRGKYIALCEGDDYWTDPLKLQKQVEFLEANPKFVLTCHDYQNLYYNEDSSKIKFGPIVKERPMTLTLLYRNLIKEFPKEFMEASNGDTFLRAMLSDHGEFYYMDNIDPSVRGVHEGGLVSTLSEIDLLPRRIKTHEALLKYYKGEKKEAFYREKVTRFRIKYNSLLLNNNSFKRKIELVNESIKEAFKGHSILYFIKVIIFNKH